MFKESIESLKEARTKTIEAIEKIEKTVLEKGGEAKTLAEIDAFIQAFEGNSPPGWQLGDTLALSDVENVISVTYPAKFEKTKRQPINAHLKSIVSHRGDYIFNVAGDSFAPLTTTSLPFLNLNPVFNFSFGGEVKNLGQIPGESNILYFLERGVYKVTPKGVKTFLGEIKPGFTNIEDLSIATQRGTISFIKGNTSVELMFTNSNGSFTYTTITDSSNEIDISMMYRYGGQLFMAAAGVPEIAVLNINEDSGEVEPTGAIPLEGGIGTITSMIIHRDNIYVVADNYPGSQDQNIHAFTMEGKSIWKARRPPSPYKIDHIFQAWNKVGGEHKITIRALSGEGMFTDNFTVEDYNIENGVQIVANVIPGLGRAHKRTVYSIASGEDIYLNATDNEGKNTESAKLTQITGVTGYKIIKMPEK